MIRNLDKGTTLAVQAVFTVGASYFLDHGPAERRLYFAGRERMAQTRMLPDNYQHPVFLDAHRVVTLLTSQKPRKPEKIEVAQK